MASISPPGTIGQTTITLTGDSIETAQRLDINISVTAIVKVDAKTARRNVTGWLVDHLGNMLVGGAPQLVIGKRTVWRVPVMLGSTYKGLIGEVGSVDVDAESGKMQVNEKLAKRLLENAQAIARPTPNTAG